MFRNHPSIAFRLALPPLAGCLGLTRENDPVKIDNSPENASQDKAIEAFIDYACERRGLIIDDIIADGQLHRCRVEGRTALDGVYKLHLDRIPAGWFHNHADGEAGETWVYRDGERLAPEELEEHQRARAAREQEMAAEREKAAREAEERSRRRWETALPLVGHEYLTKKKVAAHDLRLEGEAILVPLRDVDGVVRCVQRIGTDGTKMFPKGSSPNSLFHRIGPEPAPDGTVTIGEGYATCTSIHAATGNTVLVAFNRGNLIHVAKAVRHKWPKIKITIAADDDHTTEAEKGINPGLKDALAAARTVGATIVCPQWPKEVTRGERDNDFNDLANTAGEETVRAVFEAALKPDEFFAKRLLAEPLIAYHPWNIAELAGLRGRNRVAFERLRGELKKADVRVRELDDDINAADDASADKEGDNKQEQRSQAQKLIAYAEKAELFHTKDREAYANIIVDGHRQTWAVRSRGFKEHLLLQYYRDTRSSPSSEAKQQALSTIEAMANFEGAEHAVFVRCAAFGGKIYLDLMDEQWRVVEIDKDGWRVRDTSPVHFLRPKTARPLPVPVRGGSIAELRPFLNVKDDRDGDREFSLHVSWAAGALHPPGPYPVETNIGTAGSGKSTRSKILKALIDPTEPLTRGLPDSDRDAFIAATNSYIQVFENISRLQKWQSDVLCRISTGSGHQTRKLHTDDEEATFQVCRPILMDGIPEFVIEGDLAERNTLHVAHKPPQDKAKSDDELWAEFEAARPRILGALLDAVVNGLRNLPNVKLKYPKPRMLRFIQWAVACEMGAPWVKGTSVEQAYYLNRSSASLTVLESSHVAQELIEFMEAKAVAGIAADARPKKWEGFVGELLKCLNAQLGEGRKPEKWPSDATRLGSASWRRTCRP
jgi:phage/plasmid primase-like uncharacterized protein